MYLVKTTTVSVAIHALLPYVHVSFLPTMKSLDNVIAGDRSAPQNEELNYDFERNDHLA